MNRISLTSCFTLVGRELPPSGRAVAPCIFCGRLISHVYEGGIAWTVGALRPDGTVGHYFYCGTDCPVLESAEAAAGVTPGTPERGRIVFRCGCAGHGFCESVGDRCHRCGADREHLVPW